MEKLRWLKSYQGSIIGEEFNAGKKSAENFVSQGYAEYIIPEIINQEQKTAIELEVKKPHLKKLAKLNLEIGRAKQSERVLKEIQEEEKIKEEEKELIEKKEHEKLTQIQKEYELINQKKDNKKYLLKMKILSLLLKDERRQATEEMVKYIEDNEYIYTIKDDIKSEIWFYENGVYKPNGKTNILETCREILDENYTINFANEVISKIEADTYIDGEKFFKNEYIDEIPVLNGILNIKTKKLNPFNPKKIFFNKLPVKYNPNANCLYIKKHFEDVLKNKDDSKVMFEIFGFFLYKDYFIEKAIMFVGDGRNGKGKTIDLMKRFLGADNCSSVSLNQLSDSNFRVWDLFGKMANLAGDLSSTALKDTAMLKQTTGRDLIGADRKNKSTVNFVNYAKHVFACNDLPRVYDFSRGFWERWILFEFPYTFVKKEIYETILEKEKYRVMDVFIIDKLTTEEELSGLLNEAIEGLHRILKQKDFSYSNGVEEIKRFWVRKSDSFMAFAMDNLEESYDGNLSKMELRKAFLKYCNEHKIRGASDKNIKAVLEEMFGVTDRQESGGNRIWDGVIFKKNSKYKFISGRLSQE